MLVSVLDFASDSSPTLIMFPPVSDFPLEWTAVSFPQDSLVLAVHLPPVQP